AGRLHDEVVAFAAVGQTQAREDILNLGFLQWQAQDPAAALETHPYRRALGQGDDLVFQWTRLPAANVHDQARHVFEVFGHMLEIHATLEAMAGLRTEFVAAGPAHDGLGPPECTFKEDVGGFQGHRSSFAAHDAGHALHGVPYGKHADVRLELDHLAAQQLEGFSLARPAHREPLLLNATDIEHVGGTSQFEHHVVRDVDECRNGPLSGALELFLHPVGRGRLGIDATDHPAREAPAEVGRLDLHR